MPNNHETGNHPEEYAQLQTNLIRIHHGFIELATQESLRAEDRHTSPLSIVIEYATKRFNSTRLYGGDEILSNKNMQKYGLIKAKYQALMPQDLFLLTSADMNIWYNPNFQVIVDVVDCLNYLNNIIKLHAEQNPELYAQGQSLLKHPKINNKIYRPDFLEPSHVASETLDTMLNVLNLNLASVGNSSDYNRSIGVLNMLAHRKIEAEGQRYIEAHPNKTRLRLPTYVSQLYGRVNAGVMPALIFNMRVLEDPLTDPIGNIINLTKLEQRTKEGPKGWGGCIGEPFIQQMFYGFNQVLANLHPNRYKINDQRMLEWVG